MSETYLITGAQAEAKPHPQLLESMESFVAQHAGKLVVLPMIGQDARQDWTNLHPTLLAQDDYMWYKLNDLEDHNLLPGHSDAYSIYLRWVKNRNGATVTYIPDEVSKPFYE